MRIFVEDLHKALARGGNESKLAVKISELKIFEPEIDDRVGIFFNDLVINDLPNVLICVQVFLTVLSFVCCM